MVYEYQYKNTHTYEQIYIGNYKNLQQEESNFGFKTHLEKLPSYFLYRIF